MMQFGPIHLPSQYLPRDMVSSRINLCGAPGLVLRLQVRWAAMVGFSLEDERELALLAWAGTSVGQASRF